MAIDFPSSPSVNDTFTSGSLVYTYDGTKWTAQPAGVSGGTKIEVGNTKAEITDTGSNGTFTVTTEGTGRLSVDSSGRTLLGGVTANANGGVLQLSSGITFPATQVAATDANTLDDYEEGTWTPSLGGTTTYTTQSGQYTKVGRLVYISLQLDINVRGTGSQSRISGIPFNATFSGQNLTIGALSAASSTTNFITGRVINSEVLIYGNATPGTSINEINIFQNSTTFHASGYYLI